MAFEKKHIIVVEDAEQGLLEVANILNKLRNYTKIWEVGYGSTPKNNKKFWESKADEWLIKHIKQVDE